MPFKKPACWLTCLAMSIILSVSFIDSGLGQIPYLPPPFQVLRPRYTVNTSIPLPQEILLKFKSGVTSMQILNIYSKYNLREISFSPYSGIRRCYVLSPIPSSQIVTLLRMEPSVLYSESNWIGQINLIPNDPFSMYQWHHATMNMNLAWDISIGQGVIVAVLDTGVAFEDFDIYGLAPDLAGTGFVPGYDFVNDDPNPDDDEGHGTHITGTIAQTTNNLLGCAGGAFGATIMPVKVMDNTGNGNLTDIVDGIYFAVNNGAYILNLSLGFGNNPTLALEEAINYAADNGCLVICSAGNYSSNLPNYPAAYDACIAVSAVRFDLTLGSYSNYGTTIDICAPGGDLNVDQNLDGYPDGILQQSHDGTNFKNFGFFMGRGTSWASANASAVAALVVSAGGGALSATQVRSILENTAYDLGPAGWDESYGWGMVDAYAAVKAAVDTVATAQILGTRTALASMVGWQPLPVIPGLSLPVSNNFLTNPWQAPTYWQNNVISKIPSATLPAAMVNGAIQMPMVNQFGLNQSISSWLSWPFDLLLTNSYNYYSREYPTYSLENIYTLKPSPPSLFWLNTYHF